jgi:UDP-N-acetylmuramoyl-tripeptide--D-alanyl-D-alanine ligase
MKEMTLAQLARWCGGTVAPEHAQLTVTNVCTNSKQVQPGDLFIPLVGERFDAHQFIPDALEAGATATLTAKDLDPAIPAIRVADTLEAFGNLAKAYRQTLSATFTAITGSVGKTTTKEMLAGIFEQQFRTAKTSGNYNNEIGLPITMMSIPDDAEMAVIELGMNHFGEMSRLTDITHPDAVVITNIGTMHIEHLGSREGILQAKLEIMEGVSRQGIAVFNGDEPLLWNLKGKTKCKTLYFGMRNEHNDVIASEVTHHEGGVSFMVQGLGHHFEVYLPVEGEHNVYNALAAIAVGLHFGVRPEFIQQAMGKFQNTGMRQKTYDAKGFTIIEDCYNAGPESTEAALTVLGDHQGEGKKIAVLGDMLELGHRSNAEHFRIGRIAAKKADVLLSYGKLAERYTDGAITGGMAQRNAMHFDTHEELVNALRSRAKAGDVILFKGSRGMRMEKALEMFLADDE